jgi:hypothetical protein
MNLGDSELLRRNRCLGCGNAIAKRSVGIAVWGCWDAIAKRSVGIAVWGCWDAIAVLGCGSAIAVFQST